MKKPSQIMHDVLSGKLNHDDAPSAIQSMCQLQYHMAAKEILSLPENKMKNALTRVPETCRNQVRKRMIELWRHRNGQQDNHF